MSNPTNPILECSGLYKSFTEAGTLVQVLSDINLTVAAGENYRDRGRLRQREEYFFAFTGWPG